MNISFIELDQLKKHLADALGADLRSSIAPMIQKMEANEVRIAELKAAQAAQGGDLTRLKANQSKALVGFSVLCTGIALLFAQAKEFVVSHLRGHQG